MEKIDSSTIKKSDQLYTNLTVKAYVFPPDSEHSIEITASSITNPQIYSSVTWDV